MGRVWLQLSVCLLLVAAACGSSPFPLKDATNVCDIALFASTAGGDEIDSAVNFFTNLGIDLQKAITSRLPNGTSGGGGDRTPQQEADLQTLLDLGLPSLAALIDTKTGGIMAEGLLEKGEIDLDEVVDAKSVDEFLAIVRRSNIDVDGALEAISDALGAAMDFESITAGTVLQDLATSLDGAMAQLLKMYDQGNPLIVKELKPEYYQAVKDYRLMIAAQLANKGGLKRAMDWAVDAAMAMYPKVLKFFQNSQEAERAIGRDANKMMRSAGSAVKKVCTGAGKDWGLCGNLTAMLERLNELGGDKQRFYDCNCRTGCIWFWPNGTCGEDKQCISWDPALGCVQWGPYVTCSEYASCFVRCGAPKPPYGYQLYDGPCVSDNSTYVVINNRSFADQLGDNWEMQKLYGGVLGFVMNTVSQAAALFFGGTFVEDPATGMALLKAAAPEMEAPAVAAFEAARDSRAAWWIARIARKELPPLRGSALDPTSVAVSFLREMCRASKGLSAFDSGPLLDQRIIDLSAVSQDALASKVTGSVNLPDYTLRLLTDQKEDMIKRAVAEVVQLYDGRAMSWDIKTIMPIQDIRQKGVLVKYWMVLDPTVATTFANGAPGVLPTYLHKYLPSAEAPSNPVVGPTKPRKEFA